MLCVLSYKSLYMLHAELFTAGIRLLDRFAYICAATFVAGLYTVSLLRFRCTTLTSKNLEMKSKHWTHDAVEDEHARRGCPAAPKPQAGVAAWMLLRPRHLEVRPRSAAAPLVHTVSLPFRLAAAVRGMRWVPAHIAVLIFFLIDLTSGTMSNSNASFGC